MSAHRSCISSLYSVFLWIYCQLVNNGLLTTRLAIVDEVEKEGQTRADLRGHRRPTRRFCCPDVADQICERLRELPGPRLGRQHNPTCVGMARSVLDYLLNCYAFRRVLELWMVRKPFC